MYDSGAHLEVCIQQSMPQDIHANAETPDAPIHLALVMPMYYDPLSLIVEFSAWRVRSRSAGLYLDRIISFSNPHIVRTLSLQEFLDEIHVCHKHAPAAVTSASKLVHHLATWLKVSQ